MPGTMKMVKVKALVIAKNDGKTYEPGTEFEMEESLVGPHVAAGQVARTDGQKQATTPADKQMRGGADK